MVEQKNYIYYPARCQERAVAYPETQWMNPMDESQFKTLRDLAKDATLSQRDLSKRLGLSLGSVNYLVNALVKKGYIKTKRFKNSKNKIGYRYILTPKGIRVKLRQTYSFLQKKLDEFDRLKHEIETLKQETDSAEN